MDRPHCSNRVAVGLKARRNSCPKPWDIRKFDSSIRNNLYRVCRHPPLGWCVRFDSGVGGKINKDMESVQYRDLSLMVPNPKNPRKWKHDSEIKNLAESIRKNPDFFEARPILLSDRTGILMIIGGERRWEAARHLGLTQAPSYLFHNLTEEREDEIMNRDNVHSGVWDEAKLQSWNKEQLQSWGVDGVKWPKQEQKIKEDNFNPDKKIKQICKPGDLWQLGKHRLMCGDSTKIEDVQKLTGGAELDLSLTDPPYGIDIVKHSGKIGGDNVVQSTVYHKIKGDETTETARLSYLIMKEVTKNQIIFGGNYFTDFLPPKPCWVVWDKVNGESVFADVELAWTSFDKGARLFSWMWNGMARAGDRKTEGIKRIHPTQKPVGLFARILNEFTKEGESVLDLFAGSGATIIAAEQTNRIAYLMEYESFYCDVIIDRWETFTGKRAEKIN